MTYTYAHHIVYGLLLGDGWLQTLNAGKTYRCRYEQGDCHREYIFHVYDILQEWCSPPKLYVRHTASGTQVRTWRLQSRTHCFFFIYRTLSLYFWSSRKTYSISLYSTVSVANWYSLLVYG